jgi:NADPH:quinone reductase-like Zn-dependent oxidoreductase
MMPVRLPHVPSVDAAGVVDEVGPGITGVQAGDEVFGIIDLAELGGANAEYTALAAWAPKPDALTWEQAAAAANIDTAICALDRLKVGAGTTLLIEGAAGGVGAVAGYPALRLLVCHQRRRAWTETRVASCTSSRSRAMS